MVGLTQFMLSCRLRVSSLNQPSTRAVVFVPDHTTRGRGRLGLEGELAAGIYCEASCKLYPGPVAQWIEHWFPKPCAPVRVRAGLPLAYRQRVTGSNPVVGSML